MSLNETGHLFTWVSIGSGSRSTELQVALWRRQTEFTVMDEVLLTEHKQDYVQVADPHRVF